VVKWSLDAGIEIAFALATKSSIPSIQSSVESAKNLTSILTTVTSIAALVTTQVIGGINKNSPR